MYRDDSELVNCSKRASAFVAESREMKMQPSLERALRHEGLLKA